MAKDTLGDRMKQYESLAGVQRHLPGLPVVARIDGRCFSRFTTGLNRPFDERLVAVMQNVTRYLVEHTNATLGYTQSDEITLVWHPSNVFFDGRVAKMTSVLASATTVEFMLNLPRWGLSEYCEKRPQFDCRTWAVPSDEEAANAVLWRELDATKNSISMAARAYFSHKQLQGKSGAEMHEMLYEAGVNWNDYSAAFKRGTFVQRRRERIKFSAAEIDRLPPQHEARTNPDLEVERYVVREVDMPPFRRVTNRPDVVLHGAVASVA